MGTLKKLKRKMKFDKDLRKTLIRGTRDQILIDIDGDKEPDLALLDTTGNGNIDTLAIDTTGDGEFNLYFKDTNDNDIPDQILYDKDGDGDLVEIASGEEIEEGVIEALKDLYDMLEFGDYLADVLDNALDKLDQEIREFRKKLK